MMTPVAPLIVYEGLDVILFRSVASAERRLEVIDVRDRVYKGFDAMGRALRIEPRDGNAQGDTSVMSGQVRVRLAETEPTHVEELRRVLVRYLDEIGHSVSNPGLVESRTSGESIEQLLRLVVRFAPQE